MSRVGLECGLGVLTTPLAVLSAQVMCNTLLLLLTPCFCSQLSRSDSWVFWSFCIFSFWIYPNCACMRLFVVSYSFFVFIAQGDICPGASIAVLQQSSRFQSILMLLIIYNLRRAKNLFLISYKYKLLCLSKKKKKKDDPQIGRKYLQMMWLIRGYSPEFTNSLWQLIASKQSTQNMDRRLE